MSRPDSSTAADGPANPAYFAGGAPIDRAAFYATACDPARSIVVEACAGAGKTWVLVSRILRALLDGAEPQQILAITFTRKAAGEMRERLADWLTEFAAPGCRHAVRVQALVDRGVAPAEAERLAPTLAGLGERLLAAGRPVEISTFHAWFAQLLRAAPLELLDELGLARDAELIEDLDEHRPEVMRRFHAALLDHAALRADHALLVARRGRHQLGRWLGAVWDKRVEFELADEAGVLDESVAAAADVWPDIAGLRHPAERLLETAWRTQCTALAAALGAAKSAPARKAADRLVDALQRADAEERLAIAWEALFTVTGTRRKLGECEGLEAAQEALERVQAQVHQHESRAEHQRMVRLARLLLRELAAYKQGRGLAEMADLERGGLALLRDATLAGWVQERLDARISHVLIDEFQDTSPLQWHALHAWWSGYAGAGGGASGQRMPGLFIVGDPKQSIYRFRRADPRVFAAARAFVVEQLGGVMLACDHTRRNAPEVLAGVNAVFGAAEAAGEFDGFRRHTTEVEPTARVGRDAVAGIARLPLVPRPPALRSRTRAEDELPWRDTLTVPRVEPETVLRQAEAEHVATAIDHLIREEGLAPQDIFVLCRKRESLRLAADALRRRGVPHAAPEAAALMDAPEARDLAAVLDVLVSPQHRLSLAHALRSPLFGASDDDLIALATAAERQAGDWWAALTRHPQERPVLHRASALLSAWRIAARQLPPHDLLDRIVGEGELRERLAASVPATQTAAALRAVEAVLGLALAHGGGRHATPYNFVRRLRRVPAQMAPAAVANAVQLLTVHGAKGLEARIVFVMDADPEAPKPETVTLLVDWPVEAERPRRCAFVYSESRCPVSLKPMLDEERRARQREELNGLYVAMTRARERLVFSATEPSLPREGTWWQRLAAAKPVDWAPAAADRSTLPADGDAGTVALAMLPELPCMAREPAADSAAVSVAPEVVSTAASRLGEAVHRVLEWSTGSAGAAPLGELAAAAAAEFDAPADEVARVAGRIRHSPECARFFDARPGWHWAGNEVLVSAGGEVLRIDRLVAFEAPDGPVWWVLDYKIEHRPERLAAYRDQLRRYRAAVQKLQPGAEVHTAFITGSGAVIEVD